MIAILFIPVLYLLFLDSIRIYYQTLFVDFNCQVTINVQKYVSFYPFALGWLIYPQRMYEWDLQWSKHERFYFLVIRWYYVIHKFNGPVNNMTFSCEDIEIWISWTSHRNLPELSCLKQLEVQSIINCHSSTLFQKIKKYSSSMELLNPILYYVMCNKWPM